MEVRGMVKILSADLLDHIGNKRPCMSLKRNGRGGFRMIQNAAAQEEAYKRRKIF